MYVSRDDVKVVVLGARLGAWVSIHALVSAGSGVSPTPFPCSTSLGLEPWIPQHIPASVSWVPHLGRGRHVNARRPPLHPGGHNDKESGDQWKSSSPSRWPPRRYLGPLCSNPTGKAKALLTMDPYIISSSFSAEYRSPRPSHLIHGGVEHKEDPKEGLSDPAAVKPCARVALLHVELPAPRPDISEQSPASRIIPPRLPARDAPGLDTSRPYATGRPPMTGPRGSAIPPTSRTSTKKSKGTDCHSVPPIESAATLVHKVPIKPGVQAGMQSV